MAKKKEVDNNVTDRQTRKEVLINRKQAEQTRQVRIGVAIVAGLLLLVFLAAAVNELIIAPNRAVAIVNEQEISLSEWQDRVRLERSQRIILLNNQLDAFQGDVGIVQQVAGQVINELFQPELLGQNALNQMIDESVIVQAANERGITVTDADVDAEIGRTFNYFDGGLPTPTPPATATVEPTPSITPLPTAVITDIVPTSPPIPTVTLGPTSTPGPTATPVSAESFQQEFTDFIAEFENLDISEAQYRELVRMQLYRERLIAALAEEQELSDEAEQASFFIIQFETEEDAIEAAALIDASAFLPVWNEISNREPDPTGALTAQATEILWRTGDAVAGSLGAEIAEAVFVLPIGESSEPIARIVDAQTTRYYLVQVSGREIRPLSAQELQAVELENLTTFIATQLTGNLTLTEYDRGRTPTSPVLDPLFTAQPTAVPGAPDTTGGDHGG